MCVCVIMYIICCIYRQSATSHHYSPKVTPHTHTNQKCNMLIHVCRHVHTHVHVDHIHLLISKYLYMHTYIVQIGIHTYIHADAYMNTHIHLYIHIHIYIYIWVCIHTSSWTDNKWSKSNGWPTRDTTYLVQPITPILKSYTRVHERIWIYVYLCMNGVYVCVRVCEHCNTCIHVCMHVYIHVCMHIHMHACIHIHITYLHTYVHAIMRVRGELTPCCT